jgi:hypothetical protein
MQIRATRIMADPADPSSVGPGRPYVQVPPHGADRDGPVGTRMHRVDHGVPTEIDGDVMDRAEEEDEVAGLELVSRHLGERVVLHLGAVGKVDPGLGVGPERQPRTVERIRARRTEDILSTDHRLRGADRDLSSGCVTRRDVPTSGVAGPTGAIARDGSWRRVGRKASVVRPASP